MGKDSPYRMPLAGREEDPALATYLTGIPQQAGRAALAAGLEPLVARLLSARAAAGGEPTPTALALQEELTLRLVAFNAQVSAAAFEAGCTADRLGKLLSELADGERSRQASIAVGSLVVGALAGVVAGIWGLADKDSRGPPLLAIAGGAATTALGTAALIRAERPIAFRHTPNRLTPVWQGADPDHLYPSFVFRMLTLPQGRDGRTPRDELPGGLAAPAGPIPASCPA